MDMKLIPQLERFFSMLWDAKNQEVRIQIDKLSVKKVSRQSVARKLFDAEGEENLLLFLNLIERKDKWAMMIIEDASRHSLSTADAHAEAIDLIEDNKK